MSPELSPDHLRPPEIPQWKISIVSPEFLASFPGTAESGKSNLHCVIPRAARRGNAESRRRGGRHYGEDYARGPVIRVAWSRFVCVQRGCRNWVARQRRLCRGRANTTTL